MSSSLLVSIEQAIKVIPDHPSPGIRFYDVRTLVRNHSLLREQTFDIMYQQVDQNLPLPKFIVAIESRGFMAGTALASKCMTSLELARKPGKLPGDLLSVTYNVEYPPPSILQMERGVINVGDLVYITDDILATGGSLLAVVELVRRLGGVVIGCGVIVELVDLGARQKLLDYGVPVFSVLQMDRDGKNVTPPFIDQNAINARQEKLIRSPPVSMYDHRIVLLYHPSMRSLANSIRSRYSRYMFRVVEASFSSYPDGSPNVDFFSDNYLKGTSVLFLANLNDLGKLVEQQCFLIALSRQDLFALTIVVPYLKTATDERIERPGKVAFVEPLAKILSTSLQITTSGLPRIQIFDVHATTTHFYFDTKVINPRMLSATSLIKDIIKGCGPNTVLAYPDDGAFKRFNSLFSDLGLRFMTCVKTRKGDQRIVTIKEGGDYDPETVDHVFLLDDLVMTGGTLDENRSKIQAVYPNAQMYAYVTHAVFPNDSFQHFLPGGKYQGFTKFYVTNTIPETCNRLYRNDTFVILDIAPLIVEDLLSSNIHHYRKSYDIWDLSKNKKSYLLLKVYIASENQDKVEAVKRAMSKVLPYCESIVDVYPIKVSSVVSSQPQGMETMTGCMNRLNNLCDQVKKHTYASEHLLCIAIENGCVKDIQETKSDMAYVAISYGVSGRVFTASSALVTPPQACITRALMENKTIGDALHEEYGFSSSNWHANYDVKGRDRIKLIEMTIEDALRKVMRFHIEGVHDSTPF